jgi:hypothetical protein
MLISIEANRNDVVPASNWIAGLIGAALDQQVAAFQRQERKNPLLTMHFRETFALEFTLAEARQYRKNTSRLPKGDRYDRLYAFLISAYRIYQALPQEAKAPFEGRLRMAVNGTHGLRPLAYELDIATHLMSKNWDVEFADYTGLARFDFLARQNLVEIEVECKTTSSDTGRKIHRQEVNRLADMILPATEKLAEIPGCHLIHVTIPGRLGKSNEELSGVAAAIATAAGQKVFTSHPLASVDYVFRNLQSWPEPYRDPNFRKFFEDQFGRKNSHLLLQGRSGVSVVAVMIASAKADSVVETIAAQAKEAADQCSGTRPALIALHLVDPISKPELQTMLRTANGMHTIAGAVFDGSSRLHVDSIAFTVPQRLLKDSMGSTRLAGDVVVLNNPQPQFSCDQIRSIFRTD